MTREDFFEWLNFCPTFWEVVQDDNENIWVSFRDIQEYDDDEDVEQ
jgi:hypothetical protein